MKQFIIIGDYESIVIYKSFGWEVIYVNLEDKNDIIEKFKKVKEKISSDRVFVTEEVYNILQKEYPEFEKLSFSVIPLVSIKGIKNISKQKYKKLAAIATGIKLE
ncbi:MAG: hypothetical protein RMJ67_03800 [Elusimicrobiota bacterium]|nr:hypothetical protein [Endomicrobiia bacterium]MDW8165615.1 hypothetical protein [Elusimicrobiota bacterium]